MLVKNGQEYHKFTNVDDCMLRYQVNHCYSSSFALPEQNVISAHLDGTFDFSEVSFKNADLIVKYLSNNTGKQLLGQNGSESEIELNFTYKPYSIGTYTQNINACSLISKFLTYSKKVRCPPSKDVKNSDASLQMSNYIAKSQKGNCYLDHETQPFYRNVKRQYKFYMKMKNELKFLNGTYPDYEKSYPIINHYEIGKQIPHQITFCAFFLRYYCNVLM